MNKFAVLVYEDLFTYERTIGKRVECDYITSLTTDLEVYMTFLSTFCIEVKKSKPVAIAFYLDDTLIACKTLQQFGVHPTLTAGDTVTISPPKGQGTIA
jgi:hypothetical protein